MKPRFHKFLFLLSSSLLFVQGKHSKTNDQPKNQCDAMGEPSQEWRRGHARIVQSTGETIYNRIEREMNLKTSLSTMIQSFSNTSESAINKPCSHYIPDQKARTSSVRRNIEMLGFGKTFKLEEIDFCIKEVDHTPQKTNRNQASEMFKLIDGFFQEVSMLSGVLKDYGLSWNTTFPYDRLEYQDPGHKFVSCSLVKSSAYYTNHTWGVIVGFTNVTPSKDVNFRHREYFSEFVGNEGNLNIRWQWCNNTQQPVETITGTGRVGIWGGPVEWSESGNVPLEQNPALQNALNFINFAKEMVQDIDSGSTTAILLIPVVLCFFPLTLFHDTSTWTIFLFLIVTDIMSIIPLLLRGTELLYYGRRTEYSMISWVYGNIGLGKPGMAETWVSACNIRSDVSRWGLFFVLFAVGAMVLGIVLEIIVVILLNNRKKTWSENNGEAREGAGLLWYLGNQKKVP